MKRSAASRPRPCPLSDLSPEAQQRIAEVVAQPKPPPQWIDLPGARIMSRAWFEWYHQRGYDPFARRERIPPAVRAEVIERDGYVCGICGGDVDPSDVHLDHIKPASLGGKPRPDNLRVAHSRCNVRRGRRVEEDPT